jgi:hypothetical protein
VGREFSNVGEDVVKMGLEDNTDNDPPAFGRAEWTTNAWEFGIRLANPMIAK